MRGTWFVGLIAFAAVFSPVAAGEEAARGKRYAVLVGVKEYDHSGLSPLSYTENDVVELGKVLRAAGYVVTVLCDSEGEKAPTRLPTGKNIRSALADVLGPCKRDDLVLVAFAGHGLQFDKAGGAYFCPRDARPSDPKTLVSLKEVYQELDDCGAGVKLMLVDACRNDPRQAARSRSAGVNADDAPRPPKGVAALFSCSRGQVSWEAEPLKHGVFFHYVLDGLRGAAKDADGEVTWDALSQHVRRQVTRAIPKLVSRDTHQEPNELKDTSGLPPVLLKVDGGSAARSKGVLHALLIGIDDYSQGSAGDGKPIPNLTGCNRDAAAMRAALLRQKGRYTDVRVKSLLDQKATREAILAELREAAREVAANDLFVLYYSGSCQGGTFAESTFVAADHDADRRDTHLTARAVQTALAAIDGNKLVIVDACHAAGIVPPRAAGSSTVYLCACQANQEAYEAKKGLPGGLFTRALVEAVGVQAAEADTDGDGNVDVTEALAYSRTRLRTLLTEQKQKPTVQTPVLSPADSKLILSTVRR